MKANMLFLGLMLFAPGGSLAAQNDTVEKDNNECIFIEYEVDPEFPGGIDSLYSYLCRNVSYPAEARDSNITGKVYVSFVVEVDGSIANVRILRDIGGGCGAAVVEAVKSMPRWTPGRVGGKPVGMQFTLPVKFSLEEDEDPETKDMTREEKCLYRFNHR